ncbi:MAG: transposase [Bacteroidota bacterium]
MVAFEPASSKPVFRHAQVLVMGALLAPGRRTVASALRVRGLAQTTGFQNYHRVLNRATWSARRLARTLLVLLVHRFAGDPAARGIYRDPVLSSRGHFVKASGLRWLAFMLLVPSPG